MAGISDSPARRLARRFGADATVSELVASEGIVRRCRHTNELYRFHDSERPIGIQLFGANPERVAAAAAIIVGQKPDFIDLNFGCPARKVVERNGGSAVLKDLPTLGHIISAVVQAVTVPVTVKIRSGWDIDSLVYLEAGRIIEDSGAAAVTLHARTRMQGFSGEADWDMIAQLKHHLKIPVIGNGDIFAPEDAARMFELTGCDAVMLGRGAMGNPWLFSRIQHHLATGEVPPEPSWGERIELALEHLDMAIAHYGFPRGVFKMRSQFCHYLRGMPGSAGIRSTINRLLAIEEIRATLRGYVVEISNRNSGVALTA
jgi:nifR3 family TIM-barrel protein